MEKLKETAKMGAGKEKEIAKKILLKCNIIYLLSPGESHAYLFSDGDTFIPYDKYKDIWETNNDKWLEHFTDDSYLDYNMNDNLSFSKIIKDFVEYFKKGNYNADIQGLLGRSSSEKISGTLEEGRENNVGQQSSSDRSYRSSGKGREINKEFSTPDRQNRYNITNRKETANERGTIADRDAGRDTRPSRDLQSEINSSGNDSKSQERGSALNKVQYSAPKFFKENFKQQGSAEEQGNAMFSDVKTAREIIDSVVKPKGVLYPEEKTSAINKDTTAKVIK